VVIPTYNEKDNIGKLIEEIHKHVPQADILVVDDNSPDGTWKLVEEISRRDPRVHLLKRPGKMGLGTAYVEGFKWALERGYDVIVQMDADFSHSPEDIPRLIEEIKKGADFVVGSRYKNGVNVVNWPLKRLMISYFANVYARFMTGVPIRDLTGGFKAWRREVLESIDLDNIRSNGYSFQIEMNFKAYRKGFKPAEIPIIFYERRSGKSKFSKGIILEAALMVMRLALRRLIPERKKK